MLGKIKFHPKQTEFLTQSMTKNKKTTKTNKQTKKNKQTKQNKTKQNKNKNKTTYFSNYTKRYKHRYYKTRQICI
jgi:hypothetical protein